MRLIQATIFWLDVMQIFMNGHGFLAGHFHQQKCLLHNECKAGNNLQTTQV